jgi:hypothetical protein
MYELIGNKTKRGRDLIRFVQFTEVCESCKKKGKDALFTCRYYPFLQLCALKKNLFFFRHNDGDKPDWHDSSRSEHIRELQGDNDAYLLESRGIHSDSSHRQDFYDEWIEKCLKDKNNIYRSRDYKPVVFTTIDPAAGGLRSRYAIVSCIYTNDDTQVVMLNFFICSFSTSCTIF